jgi:hypothetical protein
MELGLSSRGASPGISISRLSAARHYRQEFSCCSGRGWRRLRALVLQCMEQFSIVCGRLSRRQPPGTGERNRKQQEVRRRGWGWQSAVVIVAAEVLGTWLTHSRSGDSGSGRRYHRGRLAVYITRPRVRPLFANGPKTICPQKRGMRAFRKS